jgi:hypothetical protein
MTIPRTETPTYAQAMGHLLVLYTQVDDFIMEACAQRLASAPDDAARLGLAKQVGDECRHVMIQRRWIQKFDVDAQPPIDARAIVELHAHFRSLDWIDFLTDLYVVIEALGSQAVERIVPLADPGTRESLRVPLQDELDHVAFGLGELRKALGALDAARRAEKLQEMPGRVRRLVDRLHTLGLPVAEWFEGVGTNYAQLCDMLEQQRDDLLLSLAA